MPTDTPTDLVEAEAAAIRLWEAKYSADQLRDMMAKGHAMRNDAGEPSYPIADEEDLRRAVHAVGRGGGSHNKIRQYIMRRAKALGKTDMIPDGWSPSGATESAESAPGPRPEALTELGEAARDSTGRRRRIQLIAAGWSKNGHYYSPAVLAEAAAAKIFPAGTPMYANHPTATEKIERPERSIQDLAARLDTDARYENGALIAEATHFGLWNPILNGPDGIAEQIGVSIRCLGEVEEGTAEGRDGLIVTRLVEGTSVDFVTEGAAGGRVLELLEAARDPETRELAEARNIGGWLEARLHTAMTEMCDDMYGNGRLTREERIGLSNGLGDALDAFVRRVERDQPQLYQRDLWAGPPDQATEMAEADTGGEQGDTPPEGDGAGEADTTQEEGRQMTESQQGGAPPPTPGTTRALVEAELTEARRQRDVAVARERARTVITQAIAEAWITPATTLRITESLMARLPLTGEGRLDETELLKAISRETEQAEREMAEALEAAGVGRPRDLGATGPGVASGLGVDRAELNGRLERAFSDLGLSESATKTAVRGRD